MKEGPQQVCQPLPPQSWSESQRAGHRALLTRQVVDVATIQQQVAINRVTQRWEVA